MVYQLSEKNQILIALIAIVVLSSGKLLKDFLFRKEYVEGLQVTTNTSRQMRRNAAGGANVTADVYLNVTLENNLTTSQSIQVSWIGTIANDVTTSSNSSDYTATVESGTTSATLSSSGNGSPITFTPSTTINAGSKIKISIKGVTIYPGNNDNSKLTFTVTPGNGESPINRVIKILPALGGTTSDYVSPTATTSAEIQAAIDGINTRLAVTGNNGPSREEREYLLKARSALVTLLASTYGTVKEAGQVFDSEALYEAQRTAIDFIKNEKVRAKNNADALKQDNINKRRMAQINTYYTRNYEANTEVMKNIIFVSVALIILAVLRNKDLIPSSIATLGVIFVLTLGGIVVGKQVFDIMRRDDHDFDKYNWSFNEDEINRKQLLQQNADTSNLSEMAMGMAPCYGPGCCDVGTVWDNTALKCIPGTGGRIYEGSAVWTSVSNGTVTISFKSKSALSAISPADKVFITLPPRLFTGMDTTTAPAGFSWSTPNVSSPIELTVTSSISADTAISIVLTGLTVASNSYSISKELKVKTTKDINDVAIEIKDVGRS